MRNGRCQATALAACIGAMAWLLACAENARAYPHAPRQPRCRARNAPAWQPSSTALIAGPTPASPRSPPMPRSPIHSAADTATGTTRISHGTRNGHTNQRALQASSDQESLAASTLPRDVRMLYLEFVDVYHPHCLACVPLTRSANNSWETSL